MPAYKPATPKSSRNSFVYYQGCVQKHPVNINIKGFSVFLCTTRRIKKESSETPLKKMGGTPLTIHRKTPLAVTLHGQKGYQSAPFSIPHPSTYSPYWKRELQQSYGTKIEQRTPMHTCPSRHPQLSCKSSNCPPDFTICNHIILYRYPGSLNWLAACSPLHPLPPTPLRAWHWLPAMHTDPPFTQFTQRGCQ